MKRPFFLGLLLLGAACGPARDVTVKTRVAVTITPKPDRLPFDPSAARIATAQAEVAKIAGHDIALDVDAAMVPEHRSGFEEALGQAFENVSKDLRELKERSPAVFAYGAVNIERVSLRYDATLVDDAWAFDTGTKTLTLRGPARRGALVPRGAVYRALEGAYEDFAAKRYAGVGADAVPAAERRAYFEWLTRGSRRDERAKTAAELGESRRAHRVANVLRLASDPTLSRDANRWLLQESSWFVERYVHEPDLVRALPAGSTFRKTEAAYAEWMRGAFARGDDDERLKIATAVFVRSFQHQRAAQGGKSYPPFAWPTLDKMAFGLEVVDEWRRGGHLTPISQPRMPSWQELVVCPHVRTKDGASVGARCDQDFYRYAIESDTGRKRLAQALLERRDEAFAEAAFTNVRRASDKPLDANIGLLRAVEAEPVVWTAGLRVLAEASDNVNDVALLEEAQRLWLERPAYRVSLLYLLARIDRYGHGNVDWAGFDRAFGAKIDAKLLASYLDEDALSFALLPNLWPALAKGYSRAGVLVPRLPKLLAARSGGSVHEGAYATLQRIFTLLCDEKNVADIEALRADLRARVTQHPGEPYAALAEEVSVAKCRAVTPRPPTKSSMKLLDEKKRLQILQQQKKEWDW